MMPGYKFIYRESPEHEPAIAGTRLTVSWVVRELVDFGSSLEDLLALYDGRIAREMVEEALQYYRDNEAEIRGYINESLKRSGTILHTNE